MAIFLGNNEANVFMIKGKRVKRIVLGDGCIMDGTETRVPYDVENYEYRDDRFNSIILTKYVGDDEDVSTALIV